MREIPAVDRTRARSGLCGAFPFGSPVAASKITRGAFDKKALLTAAVSAREMVTSLLEVDPNSDMKINRLSVADACKHAWLLPHAANADAAARASPMPRVAELVESIAAAREAAAATLGTVDSTPLHMLEGGSSLNAARLGIGAVAPFQKAGLDQLGGPSMLRGAPSPPMPEPSHAEADALEGATAHEAEAVARLALLGMDDDMY